LRSVSPWLAAFYCNLAFAGLAYAIGKASVRVHREARLSPKARAWGVLGLVGILAIAILVIWPLTFILGALAGIVRQPLYLTYALASFALSCIPLALVFWHAGLYRQNAT
jgi:hypothetical protein